MSAILIVLSLCARELSSQSAGEQPAVTPAPAESRHSIDLSGIWRVSAISDTDGATWNTVSIPSAMRERGTFSFRKRVEVPPGDAKTHAWVLHADRIVGKCDIYCNRKLLGSIAGIGEPVELRIPSNIIRDGMNEFDLQIEHRRSVRELPLTHELYAPRTEFGILGAIRLERSSAVSIADAQFSVNAGAQLVRSISLNDLEQSGTPLRILCALIDRATQTERSVVLDTTISATKGQPTLSIRGAASLQPLTFDASHSYEIRTWLIRDGIVIDSLPSNIGSRSVSVDKENILLNGAPVKIKAITYSERSNNSEDQRKSAIAKDIASIRSIGANAIRLLNIPSEYLLDRCDELGLMVLADLPVAGVSGSLATNESLGGAHFGPTIERLSRHPSVIAIGCGAENDYSDERVTQMTKKLAAEVKANSGLLTYCVTRFPLSPFALDIAVLSTFGMNDPHAIEASISAFSKTHSGKHPMMLGSCGSFCRVESSGFMGELSSMNGQSKLLFSTIKEIEAHRFAGICAMTLTDYLSDVAALPTPSSPHNLITSGLLDPDQSMRPAARLLQTYFTGQGRVSLSQNEPESESSLSFLVLGFVFMLVFFLLVNLDRRFREYVVRALMRPFNFFADIRDQRLIPNAQTTILSLIIGGSWALVIGGMLFGYREHYSTAWAVAKFVPRSLEGVVVSLAWQPWLLLIVGMLAVFFVILLLAGVIRFFAIFVRGRIFYTDALNVTAWALMPSVLLVPLGMVLPRLDHTQSTAMLMFVVLILLKLWLLYRLMKGAGVLFDIYPTRIYLFGSLGVAAVYLLMFWYLNATTALAANWPFFIHLTKSTTLQ